MAGSCRLRSSGASYWVWPIPLSRLRGVPSRTYDEGKNPLGRGGFLLAGLRNVRSGRVWAAALAAALAPASPACAQNAASPFLRPASVAYDAAGDLFVVDAAKDQVFEISVGGAMNVVAGNGTQGFAGDGGPATAAELNAPMAVAVGGDGTLYIADTGNERIRAVRGGSITTFAGTGARGFTGDSGRATSAALNRPVALAVDASGGLLICDQGDERVRRVSAGVIATVAGDGVQGFAGDGGAATAAELNEPSGIAAAANGTLFIADTGNQRVRAVSASGTISTFAGTGIEGVTGDGGPAVSAQLDRPIGLAVDSANDLLIADENNHRLRSVSAGGVITTLAGSGVQGTSADGTLAVSAAENLPVAAGVSGFGWPLVADAASGTLQILFSDGRLYAPAGLSARVTSLSASASNAIYGAAQTTVNVSGSPGTPLGAVQISKGSTTLGSGSVAQGSASVALPTLGAGSHTLTATYGGDGLHPSASATETIVVQPAPVTATAAAATVSYGAALPSLSGTLSGVLPQDQNNVTAVFAAGAPAMPVVGSYPITATLSGAASGNYTLSMAANSGTLSVVPATTVATLVQPAAAYATLPLQLTARIASTTSGTPTGTVEFLDGATVIATASLVNGSAAAVELNPASGNHTLSVAYSGDANFRASTSPGVTEAVNALPDFSVGAAGSTQQTVIAGATATFGLTVAPQGGPFTGAVTLSASGLPPGASVSFSPPAVVPGASTAAVTMSVATVATNAAGSIPGSRRGRRGEPEPALVLAGVILSLGVRRRRRLCGALAVLGIGAVLGLAGCGARTASESVLPVQSFAIQVQATGTNLAGNVVQHTVAVTLEVQ